MFLEAPRASHRDQILPKLSSKALWGRPGDDWKGSLTLEQLKKQSSGGGPPVRIAKSRPKGSRDPLQETPAVASDRFYATLGGVLKATLGKGQFFKDVLDGIHVFRSSAGL